MKFNIYKHSKGLHERPCQQATPRPNPYGNTIPTDEPSYEINICSIYDLLSMMDGHPIVVCGNISRPTIILYDEQSDT